jgi:hypothetical protein
MLESPLKPLLLLHFVTAWCSVVQSCKPLSILSFRVIVILQSFFFVGSFVSVFYFLSVGKFLKQFLTVRWLCKLFDKALVEALARGALAMCLQIAWTVIILL